MGIYIGSTEITDIKHGNTEINSVWVGSTQVWTRGITFPNFYYYTRQNYSYGTYRDTWEAGFNENRVGIGAGVSYYGSISPSNVWTKSALINSSDPTPYIDQIMYRKVHGTANSANIERVYLRVTEPVQNNGWTTMKISQPNGDTSLSRTSASYTYGSASTMWTWDVNSNPFGTTTDAGASTGDTITVSWT